MTLKIGALFAGYGGLDLAVSSVLDAEPVWFSEYDKGPSKILARRFPGVPNHGDITKIDWSQVEPVDILTGGSPCQDLSHAGARKGMTEGTRSNLWVAMREAIAELRPGLVVWENVGGAFSANASSEVEPCPGCVGDGSGTHLRALGRVLGDLATLGYDARWVALRAADVGAPHGRLRVFVTALPADLGHQWTGASRNGWARPSDGSGGDVEPCHCELGYECNDCARRRIRRRGDVVTLPTPTARDWKNVGDPANSLLPTPRAGDGEKGGPNQAGSSGDLMLPSAVQPNNWGQYASAIRRWESMTRPAPAPTETGPKGNPRLSAAFSEWMMGLPAGWVADVPGITRNEALKALGNGVVPQQCAAALRYLLAASEVAT